MDSRWIQMIKKLYEASAPLKMKELSLLLKLSDKTIKNLIENHPQNNQKYGFRLSQNQLKEYFLTIEDDLKFAEFYHFDNGELDESEKRMNALLEHLLIQTGYFKIEDLAEALYVSRATLDRMMPRVKEILRKYKLEIVKKPKYGIKLEGKEVNKRICYAHEIVKDQETANQSRVLIIQKILHEKIQKYDLLLNDINFYSLVQHCVIAINRIQTNNVLSEQKELDLNHDTEKEEQAATEIIGEFEQEFDISIPKSEIQYIVMHLLGKRIIMNQAVSEDTFACIDAILSMIYQRTQIDLQNDQELKTTLALHIQPLLSRLKFGLKQKNPILFEIKRDMLKGFELSLYAAEVIRDRYQLEVSDDELAYLALHFTVALDKKKKQTTDKKIVVVCASGRGTARLLRHRLIERYHFMDENLIILSSFDLNKYDFSDVFCILTTIPLSLKVDVPILLIDMIFSNNSARKVDELLQERTLVDQIDVLLQESLFFHSRKFNSKQEVLGFLCRQVVALYPDLSEDFYNEVMLREDSSSTEVGSEVALPHPYNYQGEKLIISFISLHKPIKWKFGQVQLVVLMAIPQNDHQLNEQISELMTQIIGNEYSVAKLIEDTSKSTFLSLIKGVE